MAGSNAYQFGDYRIEPSLNRITRGDHHTQLEPKAMAVLAYFLEHPARAISTRELREQVWRDVHVAEAVIVERIARIHHALEDGAPGSCYIEAVPGGYRARMSVAAVGTQPADPDLQVKLDGETPPFPAYIGSAPYVFVCYAHVNRAEVYAELIGLRAAGINVWYDEGITPGSEWTDELADAIRDCVHFVYFVSPASVASRNCRDELQYALKQQKRCVAVHLAPTVLARGIDLAMGSARSILKYQLRGDDYERELLSVLRSRPEVLSNPAKSRPAIGRRRLGRRVAMTAAIVAALSISAYVLVPSSTPRIVDYKQLTTAPQERFSPAVSPYPVVTDGPRVYFTEWNGGDLAIRQVSIRGGESTTMHTPFTKDQFPFIVGITPDLNALVIGALDPETNEALPWLWSPMGGAPQRLTEHFTHDLAWSRDNSIRVTATKDIYVSRGDGTESRKIATAPGVVAWSKVSPDNSRIRFTARDEMTGTFSTLWEVAIDGSDMHPLLPGWNDPPNECCGSWTPDGKYYVFQATRSGHTQLWALRESTLLSGISRQPIALTSGAMDFVYPSPTPDGRYLLAQGWKLGGEVMRYDVAVNQWKPYFANRSAEWLSYSRDGEWVGYITYPQAELWRSRIDGSDAVRLTSAPVRPAHMAWSPDSQQIAFFDATTQRVYLVGAGGSSELRALTGAQRFECCPSWSADGRSVALSTEIDVRLVDAETGSETVLAGSTSLRRPQWWPNGRYLTAVDRDGRLRRFDFETSRWSDFGDVAGVSYHIASADGQFLYMVTDSDLLRMRTSDTAIDRLVSLADLSRAWGVGGEWVGTTPDGAPLYLRDMGIYHVYALEWES